MTDSPADADARRAIEPVICYPNETLPDPNLAELTRAFEGYEKIDEVTDLAWYTTIKSCDYGILQTQQLRMKKLNGVVL